MNEEIKYDYLILIEDPVYRAMLIVLGFFMVIFFVGGLFHASQYRGFFSVGLFTPLLLILLIPAFKDEIFINNATGDIWYRKTRFFIKSTDVLVNHVVVQEDKKYGLTLLKSNNRLIKSHFIYELPRANVYANMLNRKITNVN